MDYIRQMRGFRERRKSHPISAGAIALYLAIFEYANDFRFPEVFSVSALYLRASASLSEGTFKRARAELVSQGYIKYQSGTGRQHGTYILIDLSSQPEESGRFEGQYGLQNSQQSNPQPDSDIFSTQIGPQNNLQNGLQIVEQAGLPSALRAKTGGNLARYNNYNYKDKQEEEKIFSKFIGHSSSSSREMEFFGTEEDEGQTLQEKNVQEICSYWQRDIGEPSLSVQRTFRHYLQAGMETGLICRAVEQTAASAKNPPVYLPVVLEDWKRQGYFTLAAYDAARSPRNLRTGNSDGWNSSPPSYDLEEVNRLILESAIKGVSRLQEAVV